MATFKWWLGIYLLASCLNLDVIASQGCPTGWKEFGNSCYLFVLPTLNIRQMSWEDSRANCLGYGADLVSIRNSSEVDFIHNQTSSLGNYIFWIGLYRNKTTSDPKEGWIWIDGSNFTNPRQWAWREPNNYQNNEKCAEFFATNKYWNDNNCDKLFSSICKRRKGLPDPTTPTAGTLSPTKDPPPTCDIGWVPYDRSCYRFFEIPSTWDAARKSCQDNGGHLVRIDNKNEQHFLTYKVRPKRRNYWIGLNDLEVLGRWVWEFRSKFPMTHNNWQSGEPNGLGRERCVEMYGYSQAGLWNDAGCNGLKSYICEKEEGKNMCPEGWIQYNDSCYQFNMGSSQVKSWSDAKAACNSTSSFASLVKITSKSEQDFITKQIQLGSTTEVWIGLNDLKNENIFRWESDNSELANTKYAIWANGKPSENKDSDDCVMILASRTDGAWTVQDCSLKRNYICVRHRDLPFCNAPLGMENGQISDSQITASSYLNTPDVNGPTQARLRNNGSWCPAKADQKEYLQVELPFLADITTIATEGSVTSYTLRISRDGKTYKDYKNKLGSTILTPRSTSGELAIAKTESLTANIIRIYPRTWNKYPCLRVEFVGCRTQESTSSECSGNNWEKGPGKLCIQFNWNFKRWEDARPVCLEQKGDLLTITTADEKKAIAERIKKRSPFNDYWISLNDRDYASHFYWSNNDANGLISWGSGTPDNGESTNYKACVSMKYTTNGGLWTDRDCSTRLPFICMRGEPFVRKNFAQTGLTGVWISSAKYYWPLSAIDNNKILGTKLGTINGKITLTNGVKETPNSALEFSGEGSYVEIDKKIGQECFTSPDYCSSGLTLSFMAWFHSSVVNWNKKLNILDTCGDETKNVGLSVYVQSGNLYFVVSKLSETIRAYVPIVDGEWKNYVVRWNQSAGIRVAVNGQNIQATRSKSRTPQTKNPTNIFKIGLQKGSGLKSGQVRLSMIGFWDNMLSDADISLIYTTEFGKCPFSWSEYGMSCYQLNEDKKNYYDATTNCQKLAADLVDIDSNVEQAFIASSYPKSQAWISAHDKGKEGIFQNTNGDVISYSNWNKIQPDNYYNREDCGHIKTNGGFWNDLPCYYYLQYICEKRKDVQVKPTNVTTTVAPVQSVTKVDTICHYTRQTIGCPSGLIIKVNSAFWGRREKSPCIYISVKPCGEDVKKAIEKKCNDVGSCDLHASETESYLTDPCPSIHKYLQVNYTCIKGVSGKKCKPGWKYFKDRCYGLFDIPRNWNDARVTCQNNGADLLSVGEFTEQLFVTTLMERTWYRNVWIGMNDLKTKGVYEWADGSPVSWTNWYVGQPDERVTDRSCVFMGLLRGKQGMMYWADTVCQAKFPFICKYPFASAPTNKPTTAQTVYPETCKRQYAGWTSRTIKQLDSCYYYKTNQNSVGMSWLDAQAACRSIGLNIASIQSKEENEYVRKLQNHTLWIGLEARGVFRGHVWADGSPVSYTNWSIGQPDSYNGLEACVEMNTDTGLWSDRDCNSRKVVVCKLTKGLPVVTQKPIVYPTPGSPLCKKGWTLFKGMCYIARNDSTYSYQTWNDAENICQNLNANNGHLASINSEEEQKFIEFLIKDRTSRDYWIGLNDLGTEAHYQWSDNSNYNYANWNIREPNDYNRQEDCVHLMKHNGKWNDHHCQLRFSFICKAYNESYKPPVKPTEIPRPGKDGYCPPGWLAHAQYCYEFHTDPSEYRNWDDAKDACEKGLNSSSKGELVSIHDEFELAFITIHLKGAKQWLWIGMNNRHGLHRYFWVDNTIANYFKWNTREPSSWGYGRCVEIVPYRWAAGRWNAAYCSKFNGYICKKAASDKPLSTPTPTPEEPKCPSGYKSYDQSCYKFVKDEKTFDDARRVCQKDDGDLMVVDDQFKQAYVVYALQRFSGNVWIGYVHETYSSFKFVDHSLATYTFWGPGQPSRQLEQRSCTQVNVTGANLGFWDDMDCGVTNPFVCEIYKGEPKVTVPLNASCPDGWRIYNKHCYKHFTSSRTWAQAQHNCHVIGANLVSIHDDREQDFLIYYYQKMHPIWIWTGLNDRAEEQGYRWIDNSQLDYINWNRGEPNDVSGYENCVEMQTRSGRWNDLNCGRYRQYMCKKKLECSSVIPLDSPMVTVTDTYNATSSGADKAIITDQTTNTAWCTNNTSGTAKIKVDLDGLFHVTGISVLGFNEWPFYFVRSFRIDYERDEKWNTFYPNRDSISTIQGSRHPNVMVTKTFRYPIALDGLTVTPITWKGSLVCMKIRLYGCPYVCQRSLIVNKPSRIKDDIITASSSQYPTHEPKQVAVGGHAWCAEKKDKNPWIKFSFDKEMLVNVIQTFGDRESSYVETYSVQFSGDGEVWTDYTQYGIKRIFRGNNDPTSGSWHKLLNKIEAPFVRIIPLSWNEKLCMRIRFVGCEADCEKALLSTGSVPRAKYVSSDENSNPEFALFNSGKAWCTGKSPLKEQYLEIQLGTQYRLFKMGTMPSPSSYQKGGTISTFTMTYQKKTWFNYGPRGQLKVMIAINEKASSKQMINTLTDYYKNKKGLKTKAIRIYPRDYNGTTVCLRVELYGCVADKEVIPTTQSPVQKTRKVELRFTGIEWNSKMSDTSSEEFTTTSSKIIDGVESVYEGSKAYRSAKVTKLRKGSVLAVIKIVFNPEFVDGDNDTLLILRNAVKTGKVGNLEVDEEYFKYPDAIKQASTGDDSSGLSGGAVAGVVITVLIVVVVAIGLAFFFYRRRQHNSLFTPKHFDNPISYSSKAYDMDD